MGNLIVVLGFMHLRNNQVKNLTVGKGSNMLTIPSAAEDKSVAWEGFLSVPYSDLL